MAKPKTIISTNNKTGLSPTSYAIQTAENILHQYDIHFSKQEVIQHLMDVNSFYRKLLQIPALIIQNEMMLDNCRALQSYCAKQIINVIFADSTVTATYNQSVLGKSQTEKVYALQDKNSELTTHLTKLAKTQNQAREDSQALNQQAIQDWHQLHSDSADKIIKKLHTLGFELSPDFRRNLIRNLNRNETSFQLSEQQLGEYGLKKQLSGIEKAILTSLIEEVPHVAH